MIELFAKGKRLMVTLDPRRPLIAFDDEELDWKSEKVAESILKHMGFNGGAPSSLTLWDAEVLHDIFFHYSQKPPQSRELAARLQVLGRSMEAVPYLRQTPLVIETPHHAEPLSTQIQEVMAEEPPAEELPPPEEVIEFPPPPPEEPEPAKPPPPEPVLPEPLGPEMPPLLLPPVPPSDIPPCSPDRQPVKTPPSLELVAEAQELEHLQVEVQRLSMIKAQMEKQRDEVQNMLQVERSALEEREVLVTAQAATLQSRQKELVEKERELNQKEAEIGRQRRRLELIEFLVSVTGLDKKDMQNIRAKFQEMESLRGAALEDLMGVGQLGESKSRELFTALHPNWSGVDENLAERAQALLEVGDYHGALECYEFMLRKTPESEDLWFNKAEVLGMLDDREGALQAYSRVLDVNRKNIVAWREKADLLFEASRIEEGIAALRNVIEIDHGQAEAVLAKADDLVAQGKETDAVLLYNAVLETDPGNVRAHLGLGDCLVKLGDCDMADKMYTRALGRDPQNPRALYKKGSMLNRRGRWGAALQLFNRAIALDWNYAAPWVGKGDILLKQGKPSEALDCFHKAIEFEPDNVDAWAGKGKAHLANGDREEAAAARAKAAELGPESEAVKELEKIHERGVAEPKQESHKVLIKEDSAAILKNVLMGSRTISESQVLRRLADMALDGGEFEEALEGYSEALRLDGDDVDAWCGKGLTLRKLGRFNEAVDAYDHALRLNPTRDDARRGREACSKEVAIH